MSTSTSKTRCSVTGRRNRSSRQSIRKDGTTTGEICFNTGMTGYQEVFTDPSYYGQVIIMNNVHVGNYGVKDADVESDGVKIRGLIGRNLEEQYSAANMAKGSLEEYLITKQYSLH